MPDMSQRNSKLSKSFYVSSLLHLQDDIVESHMNNDKKAYHSKLSKYYI